MTVVLLAPPAPACCCCGSFADGIGNDEESDSVDSRCAAALVRLGEDPAPSEVRSPALEAGGEGVLEEVRSDEKRDVLSRNEVSGGELVLLSR